MTRSSKPLSPSRSSATRWRFPSALEQAIQSFLHEAELLVHLTHANIVKVTDYGQYQSMPYLVMPDLPRRTLEQWLGRPIPWQEAVRLLAPIAHALEYAQAQGVLHRDLQPSNILLTDRGQPMLADFGVARLFNSIGTGHLIGPGTGTLDYMAPEQWYGRTTAQTNIYSLGVILFEMVTGRKPYRAHTPARRRPTWRKVLCREPRASYSLCRMPWTAFW